MVVPLQPGKLVEAGACTARKVSPKSMRRTAPAGLPLEAVLDPELRQKDWSAPAVQRMPTSLPRQVRGRAVLRCARDTGHGAAIQPRGRARWTTDLRAAASLVEHLSQPLEGRINESRKLIPLQERRLCQARTVTSGGSTSDHSPPSQATSAFSVPCMR